MCWHTILIPASPRDTHQLVCHRWPLLSQQWWALVTESGSLTPNYAPTLDSASRAEATSEHYLWALNSLRPQRRWTANCKVHKGVSVSVWTVACCQRFVNKQLPVLIARQFSAAKACSTLAIPMAYLWWNTVFSPLQGKCRSVWAELLYTAVRLAHRNI